MATATQASSYGRGGPPPSAGFETAGRPISLTKDPFLTHSDLGQTQHVGGTTFRSRTGEALRHRRATLWAESFFLPAGTFIGLMMLFSFFYHLAPIVPWLAAVILLMIGLLGVWPPPAGPYGRASLDWLPLCAVLAAVFFGVTLGGVNYDELSPWVHLKYLHHYSGVRPGGDARAYEDAGVVGFARGARLDPSQSVGFESWLRRYCVAPVIIDGSDVGGTFWAAGMDCCEPRGDFWCAGSSAATTSGMMGVRVSESFNAGHWLVTGRQVGEEYRRAIHMAGGLYGLPVPKRPIVLTWTEDPETLGYQSLAYALVGFAAASFASLIVLFWFASAYVQQKNIAVLGPAGSLYPTANH